MATEIKTKTVNKNIKALNKTVTAAEHMKSAYVKTREGAEKTQREESTPEIYAEGKVAGVAERAAGESLHQIRKQGEKAGNCIKEKQNNLKEKGTGTVGTGEKYPYQPKEDNRKTAGTSSGKSHAGQRENAEKQTAQQRAARESTIKRAREGRDTAKKASEQGNELGKYSIRTIDRGEKTIKTGKAGQTIKGTGKGSIKSASRYAKRAENSVKTTEKATAGAYQMAKHSAENSKRAAKAAKKAAQASKRVAKATEKAVKKALQSVARAAKAILAGTKALFGILAAGGWVVVLILIIVLLFGGLFSMLGGDNSTTVTPVSKEVKAYEPVIRKYAKQYGIGEYVELIKAVMMQESGGKGNDPMQSSQGSFNKKYPHKANSITDPEYYIECGVQELKSCLVAAKAENPMDIDHIKLALQGYNYGNGYIAWAEKNYGGYTLANAAEFSEKMAKEKRLKSYGDKQYVPHVLRYYPLGRIPFGMGNGAIVQVALTQEGNGGTTYWSWYGFKNRVSWCACFVSWCTDQCGYIESGVIPKFSLCSDGVKQFQKRKQFKDGSYVPVAGDIIFFDWGDNGTIDHVGIVESVTKGTVNTVEGNLGDRVKRHSYSIGDNRIYGYGVPAY